MPTGPSYTLRNKRVWVAGDRGLVGSALVRRLQREGCELLTAPRESVDLLRADHVERWIAETKPQAVLFAAASVATIYPTATDAAALTCGNYRVQYTVMDCLGIDDL